MRLSNETILWDNHLKLYYETIIWNYLMRQSPETYYESIIWNYLISQSSETTVSLRLSSELFMRISSKIIFWDCRWLLFSETVIWNYLLRLSSEIIFWDFHLKLSSETFIWYYRLIMYILSSETSYLLRLLYHLK